jgi:hypothetical protein
MIKFAVTETETGAEVEAPLAMHADHMLDTLHALGFTGIFITESIGLGGGMVRYIFQNRS